MEFVVKGCYNVNRSRKGSGNVRNRKFINGYHILGWVLNILNPKNHRSWVLRAKGFKYARLPLPK